MHEISLALISDILYSRRSFLEGEARRLFPDLNVEIVAADENLHQRMAQIVDKQLGTSVRADGDYDALPSFLRKQLELTDFARFVTRGGMSVYFRHNGRPASFIVLLPERDDEDADIGVAFKKKNPTLVWVARTYYVFCHELVHSVLNDFLGIKGKHVGIAILPEKLRQAVNKKYNVKIWPSERRLLQEKIADLVSVYLTEKRLDIKEGELAQYVADTRFLDLIRRDKKSHATTSVIDDYLAFKEKADKTKNSTELLDVAITHILQTWKREMSPQQLLGKRRLKGINEALRPRERLGRVLARRNLTPARRRLLSRYALALGRLGLS